MTLKRDKNSNAVINTDAAGLNKYKQERKLYRTVISLTEEVKEIKETMARIEFRLNKIENQ
jgi:hypothetical protein